ncbi:WD40-repeat-containing domain protein [Umbelopsis sp. PMI_123]|nr:WD40-repeat-containing domain protein [Umbelopsis sp. PMI_123]
MQDKKHKRLTKLIHPLKRLSLLSTSQRSLIPDIVLKEIPEQVADDLISCLPHETAVSIFALLCFKDLISVQLVCKSWRRIASDAALWRQLYVELSWRYPYLGLHRFVSDGGVTWHQRYCRATSMANWSTGNVQNLQIFNDHVGRVLATKLKDRYLVTLGEDNVIFLYEYHKEYARFRYKRMWDFGQSTNGATNVKCVDILPEINVLVVAQRGSKCLFYDINKNTNDPIQVLKGGNHILFEPESIALDRDHFVLAGRKPSAIFIWEWRKGVRISNRAFDNQAHRVFLSGDHVITISVDGSLHVFHIPSNTMRAITTELPACCLPCLAFDGSLSLVATPYAARKLHRFEWKPTLASKKFIQPLPSQSTPPSPVPEHGHQDTSASSHLLSFSASMSSFFGHFRSKDISQNPRPKSAEHLSLKSQQQQKARLRRQRRHSSYNDFGWECTARTTQYIKNLNISEPPPPTPDFSKKISLIKTIPTTQLGATSRYVVAVTIAGNRAVMVNRSGDMSIVMLDSGHVSQVYPPPSYTFEWIENWLVDARENDEDQDGYNFSSMRLSADPKLGIAYGGRHGTVWFLSFNCISDHTTQTLH